MESLDLLLQTVSAERTAQLSHFDALDAKAGITLGFAGGLIALSPDLSAVPRGVSLVLLVTAAGCAAASFWPRSLPALEVGSLRRYLRADVEFTKLTLHDTYLAMVQEGWRAAQRKVLLLRLAMATLALAGATLAVGIAFGGGHG
jgi:hypothetical protein